MDWLTVVQQLGFPIAATCALAYAVLKITIFFGEKIYLPLQEKHFTLVYKLESSLDTVNNAQLDLVNNMNKLVVSITQLESKMSAVSENLLKTVELINKLSINIDELENRIKSVEIKV